jgi:ABC-type phosphate/phosphonate transport system ATPase subunit
VIPNEHPISVACCVFSRIFSLAEGESLYEDALDLVKKHTVDAVKMREIEMQEKFRQQF